MTKNIPRIQKIKNFNQFYAVSKRNYKPYFTHHTACHSLQEKDHACLRYAIVVSKKKVHKSAVKRNKLKRRMRAALLLQIKTMSFAPGLSFDIVFSAKREGLQAPWQQMLESVGLALQGLAALGSEGKNNET